MTVDSRTTQPAEAPVPTTASPAQSTQDPEAHFAPEPGTYEEPGDALETDTGDDVLIDGELHDPTSLDDAPAPSASDDTDETSPAAPGMPEVHRTLVVLERLMRETRLMLKELRPILKELRLLLILIGSALAGLLFFVPPG